MGLGAETGSEGFISGSEGFEACLNGLQTGFQQLKAEYMGSMTWPEHHDFGALGPKEGTEGLRKGFEGLDTGIKDLRLNLNSIILALLDPG